MITVEIHVLTGVSSGDTFRFPLAVGDSIQVGRADTNDLVLSDPRISRTHCGILAREDGVYIYDLGSAAGTVHMGFQLKSGEAGARPLSSGDEFKIGDSLFRVNISGEQPRTATEPEGAPVAPPKRKKLIYGALAVALLLLVLLFLLPSGAKKSLPPQKSHIAVTLPAYRLLGYWPAGRKTPAVRKDSSHLDRVEFVLPATDHLIEYEYLSEAAIEVRVDGVAVDTLPEYSAAWRRRQLLVRDVAQGDVRKLVFDNLAYPKPGPNGSGGRHKRWAVRNVRVTPMTRPIGANVEDAIKHASALADKFDKTPDGLFITIRALQRVMMELLIDQSADAAAVSIMRDEGAESETSLDAAMVSETLEAILAERRENVDPEMDSRHIAAVASLIGSFESELWRRVDSRFRQVNYSVKAKNSIVVYDNLVAIKTMFPDETDYRWVRAHRMLMDKKIVPKKVRDKPGHYRR